MAIERLDEQFTVFVKNELAIRGLVRIRGYVKQDVPIEESYPSNWRLLRRERQERSSQRHNICKYKSKGINPCYT